MQKIKALWQKFRASKYSTWCLLGIDKYVRTSVLHGVYVAFGILLVIILVLSALSYTNLNSMNGSIGYITDKSFPVAHKATEIEIKLLTLALDLNNVIHQTDVSKIDKDISKLNRSRQEFRQVVESFQKYAAFNKELDSRYVRLSHLATQYLKKSEKIPQDKKSLLSEYTKLTREKANFVSWLSLFNQEEQYFKQSLWDDYVIDLFVQLTTYQKQVETIANEIIASENIEAIDKKIPLIKRAYGIFDGLLKDIKRESPELENNLGQYFSNFDYNLNDDKGVLKTHRSYILSTQELSKNVEEISKSILLVEEEIKGIQEIASTGMKDSAIKSKDDFGNAVSRLGIAIVIAIIFVVAVAWLLSLSIQRPMRKLMHGITEMSSGDMRHHVDVKQRNEFGQLSLMLNELTDKVAGALLHIAHASKDLKQASTKNLDVAKDTTSSLQQARGETLSVASAMNEMQATALEVASAASNTLSEIKTVEAIAEQSQNIMSETIETTENLSRRIKDTTEVIQGVNNLSEDISKIINVIKGVADQTNLLALNAAIEAARAGEHGRGFAVVADEVRSLANTTSDSANEIRIMISNLQKSVQNAVEHVDLCFDEMHITEQNATKARASIDEIKQAITKITDMSTMISDAANEQGKTSEHISNNLNRITELSENNMNQMGTVTNICVELDKLSSTQEELVNKFKLPVLTEKKEVKKTETKKESKKDSKKETKNDSKVVTKKSSKASLKNDANNERSKKTTTK